MNHHRLIILGSGPTAYTATVCAARPHLQPAMRTGREVRAPLMTPTVVDNWAGDVHGQVGRGLVARGGERGSRFAARRGAAGVAGARASRVRGLTRPPAGAAARAPPPANDRRCHGVHRV